MIHIRKASSADAAVCANLLLGSGKESLLSMFCTDETEMLEFLTHCLSQPDGQFGYANHWVAAQDDHPVGLVTAWHKHLPEVFHQTTLRQIILFFGAEKSIVIVSQSTALQSMLSEPEEGELCIGHLCVAPIYRRHGVAANLVDLMTAEAKKLGLSKLIIDVADGNESAKRFYLDQGFVEEKALTSSRAESAGFLPHLRMLKRL